MTSLFCSFFAVAQINLIPNASFEDSSTCPPGGQIYYAIPWFQPSTTNGNVINSSSTDYFHSCAPGCGNVPYSCLGYQNAKTGNGFAGMFMEVNGGAGREYLEVLLSDTLKENEVYCFSTFVSLAEMSQHYISNFEVVFTEDSLLSPNWAYIDTSQSLFLSSKKINDTMNWICLQGSYYGKGWERFMTFGNFSSPSETDVDTNTFGSSASAYYYFDDFSLVIIDTTDIHAGKDTAICIGQSVILGDDTTTDAVYYWEPAYGLNDTSAMNPVANPTITTTYILKKTICKYTMTDTVKVTVGCIGIDEAKSQDGVSATPNPSTGEFFIHGFQLSGKSYSVIDIYGKEITREKFNSDKVVVNLERFESGIYFLRIANVNKTIKLVKQ